jgi:hypothetical protein
MIGGEILCGLIKDGRRGLLVILIFKVTLSPIIPLPLRQGKREIYFRGAAPPLKLPEYRGRGIAELDI